LGKETIVTRTRPSKAAPSAEPRDWSMSMIKAKKLIRKTSSEHTELFRRLAK
jgi:hypothetical protein